jgi:hypothetical protein
MDFLNKMLGKVGVGGDPFSLSLLKRKQPTIPATDQTSQIIPQTSQSPSVNLNSPVKPEVKLPVAPAVSPTPMGSNVTQTPAIPVTNDQNAYKSANVVGGISSLTPPVPKIDTQDAQGAKESPAVPSVSPDTQKAIDSAQKAYEESLKLSPEELSTQEDLDKLVESTKTAYRDTKGQAIPLEFITGQLRSIEERATGLAEPLERKLSRLQAARTSAMSASKFALERSDKKAEAERTAAEKSIPKAPEPFTLGEGQIRYDAQGNVIARGAEKSMSETAQQKALEKKEALERGKSDTLDSYSIVNELLNNPALSQISGLQNPFTIFTPGTEAQTAKNLYQQIKGILALENRQKLKGTGAISDFESRTLEQAASALGRNLSDAEFQKQLKKIRGALATSAGLEAQIKITDPSTGESQIISASRAGIDSAIADGMTVEYQ